MPFEKDPLIPKESDGGSRLLIFSAVLLSLSLILGGLALRLFPKGEAVTLLSEVLENESVSAFLGLPDVEA